jgi:hypothetical protein
VCLEASPVDEAAGDGDEDVVQFGAAFPSDGESFEVVEQGEGLLHHVAELAESLDVRSSLAGERGIQHRIARKDVETSQRLGRHRWTIERTMAWLAGCRRLHRRYERKAEHFLAFTSPACTLICYRRLKTTPIAAP